jgi:hypothetical protein
MSCDWRNKEMWIAKGGYYFTSIKWWLSVTHLLSLQNDKDYEYLNKTVRDGRGRFLEMPDLDMFTLVKNS